jgi:hypothetical protein
VRLGGAIRFGDPSPDPLEPRRQRNTRDRHHRHDARHLHCCGFCPKHFRGAIRPPLEFSDQQSRGSDSPVGQHGGDPFRGRRCLLRAPLRRTLLPHPISGVNFAQTCSSFCPASATKIYNGNGINHAVALDGKRYTELATAFAYREKIIPGCTCNGRDAFGLVTTPIADDPTLRPGDIVATNTGLMAYSAGPNGSTFTSISTYAGLSADMRRRLAETKIEPAAEEPARPPPVREAEAMPARSVRNKQAQVDR